MIDRIIYSFFGLVDKLANIIESILFGKKKKKEKKQTSPEDLFNGE